jgi:hypothetical protein
MVEHVAAGGISPNFVRGKCEREQWPGPEWRNILTLTFHPSLQNASLLATIKLPPAAVNFVDCDEIGDGIVIRARNDWVNGWYPLPLPPAAMTRPTEWRMWTNTPPLNEFGYLYVALFIAGNYARYFPDRWLLDVERSTPLSLAIEELCALAEWRTPWLTLSELGGSLLVNDV